MEKLIEVHHIKAKVNMLSHFVPVAVQKMKFSIMDILSKCNIW